MIHRIVDLFGAGVSVPGIASATGIPEDLVHDILTTMDEAIGEAKTNAS